MANSRKRRRNRHGVGQKHGKLYVTFTWRGVRCKEYVTADATPENRQRWETQLGLISAQIRADKFEYREWFPNGTKIPVFYPESVQRRPPTTVGEWMDQWHQGRSPFRPDGSVIEDADLRPTTWLHNLSALNRWIVPHLGPVRLAELRKAHCLDLEAALRAKVTSKTRLNVMGVLHKALADAVDRDLIAANPAPRLKMPRGWARHLKKHSKPLTAEEVRLFLTHTPARVEMRDGAYVDGETLRDLYYVWFHTGWRPNELMALQFDWVSPLRHVVEIRQGRSPRQGGLEAPPKTGQREVVCDYDPMIFEIFERRRRRSLETGHRQYVFTDSRGRPLSQEWLAKRVWKPTLRTIGVSERGQYNIKDTFITLALSAGEDPGWVAQVCGTSEQMIFRHYRNWMPQLDRGNGRRVAAVLNLGPEIGPKRGVRGPSVSKIKGLRGGGGGNRTPVRRRSTTASTCVGA